MEAFPILRRGATMVAVVTKSASPDELRGPNDEDTKRAYDSAIDAIEFPVAY